MPAPPPPPLRGDTIGVGRQNSAGSLSHKTKHPAYLIVFVHSVPILPNRLSSVQMAGWGFCLVRSGLQRIYRSLFRSVHARLPGKHPLPPRRMEWIDFGHYWRINSGHRHRQLLVLNRRHEQPHFTEPIVCCGSRCEPSGPVGQRPWSSSNPKRWCVGIPKPDCEYVNKFTSF